MRIALPMSVTSPWSIEVALKLAELGHEVHVIDFSLPHKVSTDYLTVKDWIGPSAALNGKVNLHYIKFFIDHKSRYIIFAQALRKLLYHHQIQFVLVLSAGGFATMTYLSKFKPFAVYTTGSDVLMADGVMKWVNRKILRSANGIFSNGIYLAEKTVALCGRKDVLPLYMGVDTERFAPIENAGNVRLLASRGFLPVYNNEYLIQALALLPETLPLDRVIFASSGPDLERVKALAGDILPTHLQNKVVFCGGVTDEEMKRYLQESSIYVSLSRSDGTSISTLEALSCGLFPVVSDIPQNREWVDPNKGNGILVPLDQPAVLASALKRAILDESLRKKARCMNRALILERADGRRNMALLSKKMEDIFETYHKQSTH